MMVEGSAMIASGDMVPEFDLSASRGRRIRLADLRGKPFVLYFYPKADTSGCTRQAVEFQQVLDQEGATGLAVLGISRDPIKAIDVFATKHGLTFPLAADETGSLLEAFGVWVQKSMYGRSYMGIERSSFLIDANGRVARAWRKVKVAGHAAAVFAAADEIGQGAPAVLND